MQIDPVDVLTCVNDDAPANDRGATAMSTPIVLSSLFGYPSHGALLDAFTSEAENHVYSRGLNPTVEVLEKKLAALERGEACKCFSSGMAAISALMMGLLKAGDHVLFVNQVYGPTLQLARHLQRFGVSHDVVIDGDIPSIENALRPNTALIWLESPGTMLMRVVDLRAVADLARGRGITTCIDNSWATPLLQKPIELGIDVVVHSATKYLAGHSDLIAGALITTAQRMKEIFYRAYMLNGGVLAPFEAWLILRGLRTLPVRLAQHETTALAVGEFLRNHPAVRTVFFPAFAHDQQLVQRQMRGFSGVMSFELSAGSFDNVTAVIDALSHFRIGVSWGGVESVVISPNRRGNSASLDAQSIPQGLIRISLGLEPADILIEDLSRALTHAGA
jgi:cystathionine beta-lyase/cystathionine gamma-synthase